MPQERDPRIAGAVGLFFGLLPWGLGLIGITVNVWLGAVVLLIALICLSYAFWSWRAAWKWWRIPVVLLGIVVYSALVWPPIGSEIAKGTSDSERPLPPDHSRMVVTRVIGAYDLNPPYAMIVRANRGGAPASGVVTKFNTVITTDNNELPVATIEEYQDRLRQFDYYQEVSTAADAKVEVLPDGEEHVFIRQFPNAEKGNDIIDVRNRRRRLYMLTAIEYQDPTTPAGFVAVSESCRLLRVYNPPRPEQLLRQPSFGANEIWDMCGRERSLLVRVQ